MAFFLHELHKKLSSQTVHLKLLATPSVCTYLKFQLIMTTVTRMETVFIMNVNNRYLAMRGRTSDVGGKIFDTSRRNTTSDRRMLMPEVKMHDMYSYLVKKKSL